MTYDEYEAKRQAGELEPSDLDWFAEQSMNANDADPRNDEAPGVNDMIVRDRNSWERSIREYAAAKGVPFDQTMVDDVIRQVSYARNVGRDPGDFVRDAFRTIDQRAAPTLSGGGRGGDADLNRDGVADVGWTQGPGGQWTRTAVPATTSSAPVPSTGNRYAQMAAGGGGGMAGASFGDDFGDDFGAVPAAFGETYTALGRPSWLQGEYVPRQWTEQFVQREKPVELQTPYRLPTQAELEASPGYLAGASAMQRGMEHSAAAKGTVLSGGFVGRALPRALGEYAGGAYQNLVGNTLAARGQ
ncbi:MAG: hypothetical protein FJ029_15165, partial [Actinobacteria bacterium]|nr:hypothetical protein [Actinomycetota bacterium]